MPGPPLPFSRDDIRPKDRQRFLRRIRTEPGPCWVISAPGSYADYPSVGVVLRGRPMTVRGNRLAWALMVGPLPAKLFVCHHCDNPSCVRPSHLFLASHKDNLRDAAAKGLLRSSLWRPSHVPRLHAVGSTPRVGTW